MADYGPSLPPGFNQSSEKTLNEDTDEGDRLKPRSIGPVLPPGAIASYINVLSLEILIMLLYYRSLSFLCYYDCLCYCLVCRAGLRLTLRLRLEFVDMIVYFRLGPLDVHEDEHVNCILYVTSCIL